MHPTLSGTPCDTIPYICRILFLYHCSLLLGYSRGRHFYHSLYVGLDLPPVSYLLYAVFLALFFVDELPRKDLDVCVSTGVSPVSIIGNSYTLITIIIKKKKKNLYVSPGPTQGLRCLEVKQG